jgi:hypothetical protein
VQQVQREKYTSRVSSLTDYHLNHETARVLLDLNVLSLAKKTSYTDARTTDPKIENLSCVNIAFLIKVMYA